MAYMEKEIASRKQTEIGGLSNKLSLPPKGTNLFENLKNFIKKAYKHR